jgi:hypothetical protein
VEVPDRFLMWNDQRLRRTARRLACALAAVLGLASPATAAGGGALTPPGLSPVPGSVPTSAPDILILADGRLRGGHLPEARTLLNQVREQFPDTAWASWGELGLGFLELTRGHTLEARPHYEAAAAGGFQDTALVVLALLEAQGGKTAEGAGVLDVLASDPSRRSSVQEAAGLGAGYIRYWTGDYRGAALAFADVADRHGAGPLADDALYGLARAFIELGDPMSAEQVLERIAEMPAQRFDDPHARPALRNLSLKEILRATRKRYDTVPLGQADGMLVALLDVNGRVLATEELAELARSEGRAPAGTSLGDAARLAAAALARLRKATHPSAGARDSDAVAAGREHDASDLTAPSDGTLRARQHPGSVRTGESGGGRALVVFAVLAGFIAVIVRRAGLA